VGKFKASWLGFPKSANTVLVGAQSHASSLFQNMATLGRVSRLVCSIWGMQKPWSANALKNPIPLLSAFGLRKTRGLQGPRNCSLIPGKFATSCSPISNIGKQEALRVLRAPNF
jgi:hypothetical protein